MNAQDVILSSKVLHLRELKGEVERLKAECQRLRNESAALKEHFDLALVAAQDLRALPDGGTFVVVDGWNRILGSDRLAASRDELLADARAHVAAHPADFVWIVYDGARENSCADGRVRVSYTGGTGPQRADDFIVDFVRMARWLGLADRIKVVTCDRKLLRRCTQAGAAPARRGGCHSRRSF